MAAPLDSGAHYGIFDAKSLGSILAVLFYRMLRYGQDYDDRGQQFYQDK